MGISILGIKFHIPLLALNNEDRSLLAVDIPLVRLIDGKNAARAAPILALAAINACSASIISGRCNKICDDKPAGNLTLCRLSLFTVCACGSLP